MNQLDKYIPSVDLQYIICEYCSPTKTDLHEELQELTVENNCIKNIWKIRLRTNQKKELEEHNQALMQYFLFRNFE
jgi:hypothetical protein